MDIREVLAHNLKAYRSAQDLSQEELAHRADIDRTYVSSLERCVYAASVDVIDRIAKVLGIEAAELLRTPPEGAVELDARANPS
jgi:transcriptional regulator with XRE-family HTH domain